MASTTVRSLTLGQRVSQYGYPQRWAVVVDWPSDAPEDVKRMKATHVPVRLERWNQYEEEPFQYWPRANIRREGEPDRPDQPPRPFTDED